VSITYACGQCGAVDCKLWRPMSVLANEVELVCWKCLEAKGHAVRLNDADPRYRSDQVYTPEIEHTCYSPAVPDLDGSWWGYTSVPNWWVAWWKALPDTRDDCVYCGGSGKIGGGKYDCVFCKGTGVRENTEPEKGQPKEEGD